MRFYIKPPAEGNVQLHTMETCVYERIEYLDSLLHPEKEPVQLSRFDFLIPGTPIDDVGHFILRVTAIGSKRFKDFFIDGETKLFEKRLETEPSKMIHAALRTFLRQSQDLIITLGHYYNKLQVYRDYLQLLQQCITEMCVFDPSHTFHVDHPNTCRQHNVRIPFHICTDLVAARLVDMKQGEGIVFCGQWKLLLSTFFRELLWKGLHHLLVSGMFLRCMEDPRVEGLAKSVNTHFTNTYNHGGIGGCLLVHQVSNESPLFPLCMRQSYLMLERDHRLRHHERWIFTIYLKELNMMVEDALWFWEKHYSRPHACGSKCEHSWQKNKRKFIYSIRHVYGLEGKRVSAKMPSCKKIQSLPERGGCPYKHADTEALKQLVMPLVDDDPITWSRILSLVQENRPSDACQACQQHIKQEAGRKPTKSQARVIRKNNSVTSSNKPCYATTDEPDPSTSRTNEPVPYSATTDEQVHGTTQSDQRSSQVNVQNGLDGSVSESKRLRYNDSVASVSTIPTPRDRFTDPVGYYRLLKQVLLELNT